MKKNLMKTNMKKELNIITVEDLIKELKKMPKKAVVYMASDEEQNGFNEVDRIQPVEHIRETNSVVISAWRNVNEVEVFGQEFFNNLNFK